MSLSKKHLENVCLIQGSTDDPSKQCKYLRQDGVDFDKYYCIKLKKKEKAKIDEKVNEHIQECKKGNIDPTDTGVPLGDNCSGYLVLKHIEQGYDVDK